jgi:hypothetical protein
MSVHRDADDIDDDDEWDEEGAFDTDADESGDEPTVPCQYCRREILEDSSRCPYCELYVSAENDVGPGKGHSDGADLPRDCDLVGLFAAF